MRVDVFFFFNDTATTEIYTLSLHDALPIYRAVPAHGQATGRLDEQDPHVTVIRGRRIEDRAGHHVVPTRLDRKSTRLNSSHANISYAVFCLKKKKKNHDKYSHLSHTQPSSL